MNTTKETNTTSKEEVVNPTVVGTYFLLSEADIITIENSFSLLLGIAPEKKEDCERILNIIIINNTITF